MPSPALITEAIAADNPPRIFPLKASESSRPLVVDLDAFVRTLFTQFVAQHQPDTAPIATWRRAVTRFVSLLRSAGFHLTFALSGPAPLPPSLPGLPPASSAPPATPDDFASFVTQARANELYMRVAPATRSSTSFQLENGVAPPLAPRTYPDALLATTWALREAHVPVVYSAEPQPEHLVDLALLHAEDSAVILSEDDTLLVRAIPRGGVSYAPLSSVVLRPQASASASDWQQQAPPTSSFAELEADDGFASVSRKRGGRKNKNRSGSPAIAPTNDDDSSLPLVTALFASDALQDLNSIALPIYTYDHLATTYNLPSRLLPMLAAFSTVSAPIPGTERKPGQPPPAAIEYARLLERALPVPSSRLSLLTRLIQEEWGRITTTPASQPQTPPPTSRGPVSRLGLGRGVRSTLSPSTSVPSSGAVTPRGAHTVVSGASATAAAAAAGASPSGASAILAATSSVLDPVQRSVAAVLSRLLLLRETNRTGTTVRGSLPTALADVRDRLAPVLHDRVASYAIGHGVAEPDLHLFEDKPFPPLNADDAALLHESLTSSISSDPVVQQASWWTALPDPTALITWRGEYASGLFPRELLTILTRRSIVVPPQPEHPDWPSIQAVESAPAQVRMWTYAILFDNFGMRWASRPRSQSEQAQQEVEQRAHEWEQAMDAASQAEADEGPERYQWVRGASYHPDEDPEELISVGTPSSHDPSRRGSLVDPDQQRDQDEDEVASEPSDLSEPSEPDLEDEDGLATSLATLPAHVDDSASVVGGEEQNHQEGTKPDPIVREWVTVDDRLVQQIVPIEPLTTLLQRTWSSNSTLPEWVPNQLRSSSIQLHSVQLGHEARLAIAYIALSSSPSLLDKVPVPLMLAASALRLTVVRDAERMERTATVSRRAWWTYAQVHAAVSALVYAYGSDSSPDSDSESDSDWAVASQDRAREVLASYAQLDLESSYPLSWTIHRAHALSSALQSVHWLLGALALEDEAERVGRMQGAYDPMLFQLELLLLSSNKRWEASSTLESQVRGAVVHELEPYLAPESQSHAKVRSKGNKVGTGSLTPTNGSSTATSTTGNLFASLME